MKRPPFQMVTHRSAMTRRSVPGHRPMIRGARASYCWQWFVLVPIACGAAPDGVEIRLSGSRGGREHPWYLIDYTPDEAYRLICRHYPAGTRKLVESHRARRGLARPAAGFLTS